MSPAPQWIRRLRTPLASVLLLMSVAHLRASDRDRDLAQTIAVRQRFLQDPELADLNLGIRVRDRVAVLWGPVPTATLAFKAELLLRKMDELNAVRNELVVGGVGVPEPKSPAGVRMLPVEVPPSLPERVRQEPTEEPPPLPPMSAPMSVEATLPEPNVALPSIRLPLPSAEGERPSTAATQPSAIGPTSLEKQIQAVMQSKETFQGIRFALRDQRVYLKAVNHGNDVLHELARALSRLPGIENVVILDKATPR